MTNQDIIKYLNQYQTLDKIIDRQIEEREKWKSRAYKITPTWSDMPKGSDGENPRELAICKMIDMEKNINSDVHELYELGEEIRELINCIGDKRLILLMQLKYIDGYKWEKVAEEMKKSRQWVTELHGRALEILSKKINK